MQHPARCIHADSRPPPQQVVSSTFEKAAGLIALRPIARRPPPLAVESDWAKSGAGGDGRQLPESRPHRRGTRSVSSAPGVRRLGESSDRDGRPSRRGQRRPRGTAWSALWALNRYRMGRLREHSRTADRRGHSSSRRGCRRHAAAGHAQRPWHVTQPATARSSLEVVDMRGTAREVLGWSETRVPAGRGSVGTER